ncbi:monocarboxylate transporter [Scheffersomyces coipomensis]|uniref:monocarboxylate transporter n=1 Tax=Scheffersomyces coipomensis TaxID=1788519 RepID=UPI00315CEFE6
MNQEEQDIGIIRKEDNIEYLTKLDEEIGDDGESTIEEEHEEHEEHRMNGGYSWVILCCTFSLTAASWGNNSGYGIYFSYYSNNHVYQGASTLDYAAIGGILFGTAITFAPLINSLTGKIGVRKALMIGNFFQFISLFLTSFDSHHQLWQPYITQGVLQSIGLAFLGLPAFTILPHWFTNRGSKEHYRISDRMLTLSQGISTAGCGAGGILFNLGMQKVLEVHGERWALRVQSFISIVLVTVPIIFLKERHAKNVKIAFTIYNSEILKFAGFWGIVCYVVFSMLGYVVTLYSLSDWTISLGYTAYQGSITSSMISIGMIVGRPTIGLLADRFGAFTVATIIYFISAVFVLTLWMIGKDLATAMTFAFFMGAISGTFFPTFTTICLNVLGFRLGKLNVTFYMSWVFLGISAIFSPIIGISLKRNDPGLSGADQYRYCAVFVGVSFTLNFITLIILRGYVISTRNMTSLKMSDTEYFKTRPNIVDIFKNSVKFRGEGWL